MPEKFQTRRVKSQQRERKILETTQEIVARDGFLGLKMSDLARAVGISVGTLYVHFESKEDLIIRLATEAWRGRLAELLAVLERDELRQGERLVAVAFVDFLFSLDHPELFAAEQLASTSAVLEAASDRRVEEMFAVHHKIKDLLAEAARRALETGELRAHTNTEEQAQAIDRGVWTLMVGSSYIWYAEKRLKGAADGVGIPDWVRGTVEAFFRGHGWSAEDPHREVERIAEFCLAMQRRQP